jgi:hypothetical protein
MRSRRKTRHKGSRSLGQSPEQVQSSRRTSSRQELNSVPPSHFWFVCLRRLFPVAIVTALPVAINTKLWLTVLYGGRPRAWDGSGHYAIAQIYDQTIFPDTFGWTHVYFAGMPFPNFYPPLFFWCVALAHHTHLLSFAAAFKLMVALPVLLLPAAVWLLAWAVSNKNRLVAISGALAIIPLLIDYRFNLIGLSYHSTFLIGLYTQPLGFVLLALWYVVYLRSHRRRWQFALASVLLAMTVLASFFNAVTAALFVVATVTNDLVKHRRATDAKERGEARTALAAHLISPFVAACLTLFWVVPMLSEYNYFVTRPHVVPLGEMVPPAMWGWYALSSIGIVCWLRRPTQAMWSFLAACVVLAGAVVFASTISPKWFPLQAPRFLSTLNFLLAVPVGQLVAAAYHRLAVGTGELPSLDQPTTNQLNSRRNASRLFRAPIATAVAIALLLAAFALIKKPSYKWAFHGTEDNERIDDVLRFADQHRDGRYLIEVPDFSYAAAALDSRGLNAYLGAQGNDAVKVVFHEASANAIFFNPLVTTFSSFPDNFGISSVLADDLDFVEQPLARHIDQARFVGVRYLVIVSPDIKGRLVREPDLRVAYDSKSGWTIFELQREPMSRVRALEFRPALVVSNLSLKQRRHNDYDFVRMAEEQFADGWFDVLLVRSDETKIDRIRQLDEFGALILDTYETENTDIAFERLRRFSRDHLLILLSSNAPLFNRIRTDLADFPLAEVIERPPEPQGEWIEAGSPSFRYGASAIRGEWQAIQRSLHQHTAPTGVPATAVKGEVRQNAIQIDPVADTSENLTPVLIETTYHPSWRREDGRDIYAATPFFMLTFVHKPTRILYTRGWFDKVALLASVGAFLSLCCFTGRRQRKGPGAHQNAQC